MSCIFDKDKKGNIISVKKPDGSPSQLYKEALEYTGDNQEAINMVAITQTEDFQENVDYTIDEPSFQQVLDYILKSNANPLPMSAIQRQDLKNSLLSLNVNSVAELQDKLNNAFYDGELFNPTEDKLVKSGIYSPYEIRNIISDISLQERIKSSLEGLNNTDYEEGEFEDFLNVEANPDHTSEINSFGKVTVINPYISKQDAVNALAAPQNRQDFNDKLDSLEIPVNLTFEEASVYVRADEYIETDGIVSQAIVDSIQPTLETAVDLDKIDISDVNFLRSVSDSALVAELDNSIIVVKDLERKMALGGLDVIGLSEKIGDNLFKPFLNALNNFYNAPTTENTTILADIYNRLFEKDTTFKTRPIKNLTNNRNYVYLETNKPEDLLLTEDSLLKIKDNTFIKVRRVGVQELYDILDTYPGKEITPTELANLSAQLENISNFDNSEELILMKRYYDTPMVVSPQIEIAEELNNSEIFEGNVENLFNNFPAQFNSEAVQQKEKNSDQWNNFYRFFTVNSRGIALTYTDPLTLNNLNDWIDVIKPSIARDLKQYSLISRQLPVFAETEIDIEDTVQSIDSQRDLAVNYPMSIEKLNKESFRVDDDGIIVKNPESPFIRVGTSTYESVQAKDNIGLYVKLPAPSSDYKSYKNKRSSTNIKIDDYTYLSSTPDSWLKSKKENKEIKNQNFNC